MLNLVDLALATASLVGAGGITLTAGARHLVDLIGPSEHLVLILADGFGMNFLGAMDSEALAPRHLAVEIQTVFPSTTAANPHHARHRRVARPARCARLVSLPSRGRCGYDDTALHSTFGRNEPDRTGSNCGASVSAKTGDVADSKRIAQPIPR